MTMQSDMSRLHACIVYFHVSITCILLLLLFRLTHQQEVQRGGEDNTLSYLRQKC